ncbi:hypothetical protein [Syntrophobacter fumaroxidans]|nr:hypothetical protein [Syntrophobacter fumaroxidans]
MGALGETIWIWDARMENTIGKDMRKTGRWRRAKKYVCELCSREQLFCWTCPCGFMICPDCMEENFWGMTCNGINWTCPECGAIRPFGND